MDVEAAQVGLHAGVLNRDEVCGGPGFVEVGVPHAGWGHEGATGFPVHAGRVGDVAPVVEVGAQQRVAPWLSVEDQVECDGLVTVGALFLTRWQQAEHRPQHVGDRQGLSWFRWPAAR